MNALKTGRETDDSVVGLGRSRGLMVAVTAAFLIGAGTVRAQEMPEQIVPLEIEQVIFDEELGQFVAIGALGPETFELPIDLDLSLRNIFEEIDLLDPQCPILDLQIGPIFLDLLGLQVETSAICLEIWAEPNGLLGNLLCAIAGGLELGLDLDEILAGLTEEELTQLLEGLRDLLDEILAGITNPANADVMTVTNGHPGRGRPPHAGQPGPPPHAGQPGRPPHAGQPQPATQILYLEVGPVFLDLLGLVVYLHDCEDGPVWVEVRAVPGEGRLLGNLLSQLSRLLDRDPTDRQVARLLRRIADEIDRLLELQ